MARSCFATSERNLPDALRLCLPLATAARKAVTAGVCSLMLFSKRKARQVRALGVGVVEAR